MKFISFKRLFLQWVLYGLVTISTLGCGAPVALLANPDKDIGLQFVRPAGFKLSSVTIVWIGNSSIPIKYQYRVPKGLKDVPASPEEVKKVEDDARKLLTMLHTKLPVELMASLEKSGVQRGDDYKIELKPMRVDHIDNYIGTTVDIEVNVRNREGLSMWTSHISAARGYSIIGIGLTNQDNAYIEKTIEILFARMRKAGLLT